MKMLIPFFYDNTNDVMEHMIITRKKLNTKA